MMDNTFIKKYLSRGILPEQPPPPPPEQKLPPPPSKQKPPSETFDQLINRYNLWQISGANNMMNADQVKTGKINIIDRHQPWNVISEWKLGYFDGGVIRQMYNWSQTRDINYLKSAMHYLSKMLEVEQRALNAPLSDTTNIQADTQVDAEYSAEASIEPDNEDNIVTNVSVDAMTKPPIETQEEIQAHIEKLAATLVNPPMKNPPKPATNK